MTNQTNSNATSTNLNSISLEQLCPNITKLIADYIQAAWENGTIFYRSEENYKHRSKVGTETDSLVYIIVVLMFYSFGIVFMMVKYMRVENREMEESKLYHNYIKAAREKCMQSTNRGRLTNRLALQALNTVNAIPQATQISGKVTFV